MLTHAGKEYHCAYKHDNGHKSRSMPSLPSEVRDIRDYVELKWPILLAIFVLLLTSIWSVSSEIGVLFTGNSEELQYEHVCHVRWHLIEAWTKSQGKKKKKKRKGMFMKVLQCCITKYLWPAVLFQIQMSTSHAGAISTCGVMTSVQILTWSAFFLLTYTSLGGREAASFLPEDELKNPPANGIFTTFMEEDDMYATLNDLYRSVSSEMTNLAAILAERVATCLELCVVLLLSASWWPQNDDSYAGCYTLCPWCWSYYGGNNCRTDPKQQVGDWKNPHCAGDETAARSAAPGA